MKAARTREQGLNSSSSSEIKPTRPCNLCQRLFITRSRFDRFCGACKSEKEVLRYSEWLPNLSIAS